MPSTHAGSSSFHCAASNPAASIEAEPGIAARISLIVSPGASRAACSAASPAALPDVRMSSIST